MPLRKDDVPIPHHVLEKFLGRGALGDVWLARGPGGVQKALKFMRLERSGIKELMAIQRMKRIHHPHLVQVTDVWMLDAHGDVIPDEHIEQLSSQLSTLQGSSQGTRTMSADLAAPESLIVAMTLADMNLADRLDECKEKGEKGIPRDELLHYFQEAAKGLDFLNQPHGELAGNALQHCDVKPQNLLLVGGSVQICDFGLARLVGEQKTMNQVEGTLAFMAPEAARGKQPTPTTDQYSLAISYYQLLTGSFPFNEDATMYEILAFHTSGTLDFSKVSPAEQKVLRRATAVKPENRYPTNQAFVAALIEATAPAESRPTESAPTKFSLIMGAVAVALLVVAVVIGWLVMRLPTVPLPENFQAVAKAESVPIGEFSYPTKITRVFEDGEEVVFLLIHEPQKEHLFYIMENKVWNSLFERYVNDDPEGFRQAEEPFRDELGYPTVWLEANRDDSRNPRLPAVGMNVDQAYGFARWLAGEQGHLPSMDQWDTAAGLYRPERSGKGPYRTTSDTDDVEVARKARIEVGTAAQDISLFGVRDMANNGLEFTRTMWGAISEVPKQGAGVFDAVIARGNVIPSQTPLSFDTLEDREHPHTLEYLDPTRGAGFRVVIQKLAVAEGGGGQ